MTIRFTRRTGRAALAAAALALAGCSAEPPLSPAADGPRASRQAGADAAGGNRASIYVIGSGRGHRPAE